MRKKPSEMDFEEYIRQIEPAKRGMTFGRVDGVTNGTEMTKKPGRCGVSLQK